MMQRLRTALTSSRHARNGFTLVEILVVVALIAFLLLIALAIIPIERGNRLDGQAQDLLSSLRNMQSNARVVADNKEYGVSFSSSAWSTYSIDPVSGTQTTIETRPLRDASLSISITPAASQVTFQRLTGTTKNSTDVTITIRQTSTNKTKTIYVKPSGVIYAQ